MTVLSQFPLFEFNPWKVLTNFPKSFETYLFHAGILCVRIVSSFDCMTLFYTDYFQHYITLHWVIAWRNKALLLAYILPYLFLAALYT